MEANEKKNEPGVEEVPNSMVQHANAMGVAMRPKGPRDLRAASALRPTARANIPEERRRESWGWGPEERKRPSCMPQTMLHCWGASSLLPLAG